MDDKTADTLWLLTRRAIILPGTAYAGVIQYLPTATP